MKKFLGTLIALSAVMALAAGVQAAEYSAGSTTVSNGTAAVPVVITPSGEESISGYIVTLTYDSSKITPAASETADPLGEKCYANIDSVFAKDSSVLVSDIISDDDEDTDILAVAWASAEAVTVTDAANMAVVNFTVDESVTEDVEITVNVVAVTSDGESIDNSYTVANGTISVSASGITYGDVNYSGDIDPYDASLVLQYYAGSTTLTSEQLDIADVNLSDDVTPYDASLILQYYAGIIESLPVKE